MPQDYSGQKLRGRSFRGQNLEGANFSYADIRSADFTGANLRGANFSHATAGLQKRWAIFLVFVSWLLSGLSGVLSALNGCLVLLIFDPSLDNKIGGWTILIVLIAFFFVTIRQGVAASLGAFAVAVAFAGAFAIAFNGAGAGAVAFAFAKARTVAFAFAGAGTVAFAFAGAGTVAFAFAGAGTVAFAGVIAVVFAGVGAVAFAVVFAKARAVAVAVPVAVAVAVAVAGTLVSIYIRWRAMKGDQKHSLVRNIAITFAATGGTSFRGANLTNADFTQATLKSTDLRNTILTNTHWHQAKMLDRVRPGLTYLQNSQVLQLLVTGQGQDKNFDGQNLRGINLQKANLADASFIGADLSEANLQDADLSRAKLKQTQLDGTDLTGATLTGAYIEDWGITRETKLHGVRCEYVFMRLPTKEDPDPLRKPDNNKEVFADGDFADFIKPIFDTLDLYHNQNVDPRAIAISFKQLAENHPEADLRIVGMEVRGEDKFLLRAKTAPEADKSQLSAEYFEIYNQLKALAEQELKALIAEKDSRIRSLETMVMTALERPSFYSNIQVEEVGTMNPNQGGINQSANNSQFGQGQQAAQGTGNQMSMNNNENYKTKYDQSNANIGGFVDTAQSGSQQTFNQNISSSEQKQNLAEAAAEIQALLEQLSQSYPTETMSGKMALAAEATQRIENNPTLMQKTISALRAGGTAALEQALSHPAASFVIAALDDWTKNNQ
jgi:uncharacterized protein YjbI with pentapeptide repeats